MYLFLVYSFIRINAGIRIKFVIRSFAYLLILIHDYDIHIRIKLVYSYQFFVYSFQVNSYHIIRLFVSVVQLKEVLTVYVCIYTR